MTISLIAASAPGGSLDSEVPIATNATFARSWFPAAEALGLSLVQTFPDGLDVTVDMIPALLEELELLERHFSERPGSPEAQLVTRVSALRKWLAEASHRELGRIYIG